MQERPHYEVHYDLPTAVTFLLAGLGAGWLLALLMPSRDGEVKRASSHGVHARVHSPAL
jgi:hypothetical protein